MTYNNKEIYEVIIFSIRDNGKMICHMEKEVMNAKMDLLFKLNYYL